MKGQEDAALKLDFLIRHPTPRRVLGHESTMVSFAEKLGVARKTLIDQRDNNGFSSYVQHALAEKLKFALEWPEWLTGDVAAFRERYLREHESAQDPAEPAAPARAYDPSVRLRAQRLVRDASPQDEARPTLASLSLFLQQAGPGESIPVSVELICQPEPVGPFEIAVHRGRLEIVPGAAGLAQTPAPLATDADHTVERGGRTLTLQRGNASARDGRMAWIVSSSQGAIGVLRLAEDDAFCRLAAAAHGDVVGVEFQVYVKDLDLVEGLIEDTPDDRTQSYSLLSADGKPLSQTKWQAIKRMILKDELGAADKGWHLVADEHIGLARNE